MAYSGEAEDDVHIQVKPLISDPADHPARKSALHDLAVTNGIVAPCSLGEHGLGYPVFFGIESDMTPFLITRKQWTPQELVSSQVPKFFHPNKQLLYEMANSSHHYGEGKIGFSRWARRPLPNRLTELPVTVSGKPGFFDYVRVAPINAVEWHMNFANNEIFSAWATSLFAQDELQVAEHPHLITMRLAAVKEGLSMFCVEDSRPRPILITGVERRLSIDTAPNPQQGRPGGLYGNAFKRATEVQIESATSVLNPPSITNLLAIETPAYGRGRYTHEQIGYVLDTAYAGFSATRDESRSELGAQDTVIHTGFWGCGAYGGNRVLMLLLQMIAADLARLSQIVFHTGDDHGVTFYREALAIYDEVCRDRGKMTDQLIQVIADREFIWGESDGN